jgi:hypothetical protein
MKIIVEKPQMNADLFNQVTSVDVVKDIVIPNERRRLN